MKSSTEQEDKKRPELFFGLVGAVGTDLASVTDLLVNTLQKYQYQSCVIRLSGILDNLDSFKDKLKDCSGEHERIERHMDAGDELREKTGRGDALALLSLTKVRDHRIQSGGVKDKPLSDTAYIFNSLKLPIEVNTLRSIYGAAFFLISVYSPRRTRVDTLSKIIAKSCHDSDHSHYREKSEHLIAKDMDSERGESGQNVKETFPMGDFFLRMGSESEMRSKLERFVSLIFGHPFRTPSVDELAMFHARASSLRSADLSRQVGAVIVSPKEGIISAGCNEVPKAGGGHVWDGDERDNRDFQRGYDPNARMREEILGEILEKMKKREMVKNSLSELDTKELVDKMLRGEYSDLLKSARLSDLLEFGRIVHAEMSAISDAALRGIALERATLYCTTFPCHMCARHIISTGIRRVVFIEPYPKSMAEELYSCSVVVDPDDSLGQGDKVVFESFCGVSPNRFIDLFTMPGKRKDSSGRRVDWQESKASPRAAVFYPAYTQAEDALLDALLEEMCRDATRFGLTETPNLG